MGSIIRRLLLSSVFLMIVTLALSPCITAEVGGKNKVEIEWSKIKNPIMDRAPEVSVRDPLLHYNNGIFRLFYSAVEYKDNNFCFYLETVESRDLVNWSKPRRLTDSKLGFSSPGNILKIGDSWVMSVQTYPVPPGETYASEEARLWYMKSKDLEKWEAPVQLKPQGAEVKWTDSKRQIDPCFVEHAGKYWSLYKTGGNLGLLVSEDFKTWKEASPDRPILAKADTPDQKTVENPCVFKEGDEYILIFSPCRRERGVGIARSKDLLHWNNIHYINFPKLPWSESGPSAAQVVDLRDVCGKYVMVYHGERKSVNGHAAAMGIAWGDDLEHWTVPGSVK